MSEKAGMIPVQGKYYGYMLYKHGDAEKEKLPLILCLHGAGERGDTLDSLPCVMNNGLPQLIINGYAPRCIIVCPQCPSESFWITETQTLRLFIDEIVEKYNVDTDRISLTGLSMGGFGTWMLAIRYPELFSCIAPVCGGGMPWAVGALKEIPIRAFHGDEDDVVNVRYSIDMIKAVRCWGNNNAELTIYNGVKHASWEKAYDDKLVEFLISQKRRNS